MAMSPSEYDAWYTTQRGKWIGEEEYHLIASMLAPRPNETMLDVGCGTGYFTRKFAADAVVKSIVGTDVNLDMLRFAAEHSPESVLFVAADARNLPFPNKSFDLVFSIAVLCFIPQEKAALHEMIRVARRKLVLGLLNRRSMLYFQRGRHGGKGGYRGAHWHTPREALQLFHGLKQGEVEWRTIIVLPNENKRWKQKTEARLRRWFPGRGAFLAVSATT